MSDNRVFVISLEKCTDRRFEVKQEMDSKGIHFEFFNGIDGHNTVHPLFSDYDYKKRLWLTSGKMPSKGELGCYASHYLMWVKCLDLNKPIIVFEDDVKLNENAQNLIDFALDKADEFGFLRLEDIEDGGEYKQVLEDSGKTINLMKDNYGGLRAYAIAPKAAAQLIKHRWCLPVDCFVGANFIHGVYSYQVSPSLVIQHNFHESTIQNKDGNKTALYRKLSRELYTGYKKIMLERMYRKMLKKI